MRDILSSNRAFKILEKSMDISARRHRLITNNLANMDTIGYKPRDIDFNRALEKAMKTRTDGLVRTHPKHMATPPSELSAGSIRATERLAPGVDPVNIDTEMTNLVENNLKYRTSVEMLLRKVNKLKHVISEGGR